MKFSSFLHNYGYTNGDGKTHRSVLDKITLAVQAETPFMDTIGRAKMDTPNIVFFEEELKTGNHTDTVKYGESFSGLNANHKSIPTITQRTEHAQQFAKGVSVTDEQEGAKKDAKLKSNSEMDEELYAKMIEHKTDIEASLLQNGAGAAGTTRTSSNTDGTITTATTLGGAFSQLDSSVVLHNNATAGTTTASTTNGQITAGDFYNEDTGTTKRDAVRLIDRVSVALYNNGGLSWKGGNGYVKDANMILLTPNNNYDFDIALDSRPNVRRNLEAMGDMLGMAYTSYRNSYGTFKVMPDRFLPGGSNDGTAGTIATQAKALIFNPQNWALGVNQDTKVKDMGTTGLSEEAMVSSRFGLIHRNRKVSGAVEGINPIIAS